jgi:putative ABC transport system permease protein
MLRNYLRIALRNILKHKSYAIVNIAGLAVGIACCLLILLYVQDELSYDRFHENAAQIYRATLATSQQRLEVSPSILATIFQREFPEVARTVRFYETTRFGAVVVQHGERIFQEERFMFADSTVFEVFTFPFIAGNPATALTRPNTIVITQATARKYFGEANPLGQTLRVNNARDYEITGVIQDVPRHSHLQFDFLASYVSLTMDWVKNETWYSANLYTYLLLHANASLPALEQRIPGLLQREKVEFWEKIALQKLTRIHLYWNNDIARVYIFSSIAFLVLLVACINYMNLATARSLRRAREVGVRKVLGAVRGQLASQFYGEIGVITLLALALAVLLVELARPAFNAISDKQLAAGTMLQPSFIMMIVAAGALVTLISGSYPALFLSAFQPGQVLKSALKLGGHGAGFRKGLVVTQFVISIALISGTTVVYNQLAYLNDKKLGFEKEQVLILPMRERTLRNNYATLKAALTQHSNIVSVAAAAGFPGRVMGGYVMQAEGLPENQKLEVVGYPVDSDIIKTLGLELLAGRGFPETWTEAQGYVYVINEHALQILGWQKEEAVGKWMNLPAERMGRVVGVVKDFHFASLHAEIKPLAMFIEPPEFQYLLVKLRPQDLPNTLAFMRQKWQELAPNSPFDFSFLDRTFAAMYRAEQNAGRLLAVFAALAILIACLGLFGLASFTAEQRTKEIGVRKVLGATVASIIGLLSQDFVKLVAIAFVITTPLAYFAMHRWLQNFAYRTDLGWWVFALAGGLALLIALLTVSTQALKAARANPVESLRYE